MYLHLGEDVIVKTSDIIAVFDMDTASTSRATRDYLNAAQRDGKVSNVSQELPKSFILCGGRGKTREIVYVSQISSSTLLKRLESSHAENYW